MTDIPVKVVFHHERTSLLRHFDNRLSLGFSPFTCIFSEALRLILMRKITDKGNEGVHAYINERLYWNSHLFERYLKYLHGIVGVPYTEPHTQAMTHYSRTIHEFDFLWLVGEQNLGSAFPMDLESEPNMPNGTIFSAPVIGDIISHLKTEFKNLLYLWKKVVVKARRGQPSFSKVEIGGKTAKVKVKDEDEDNGPTYTYKEAVTENYFIPFYDYGRKFASLVSRAIEKVLDERYPDFRKSELYEIEDAKVTIEQFSGKYNYLPDLVSGIATWENRDLIDKPSSMVITRIDERIDESLGNIVTITYESGLKRKFTKEGWEAYSKIWKCDRGNVDEGFGKKQVVLGIPLSDMGTYLFADKKQTALKQWHYVLNNAPESEYFESNIGLTFEPFHVLYMEAFDLTCMSEINSKHQTPYSAYFIKELLFSNFTDFDSYANYLSKGFYEFADNDPSKYERSKELSDRYANECTIINANMRHGFPEQFFKPFENAGTFDLLNYYDNAWSEDENAVDIDFNKENPYEELTPSELRKTVRNFSRPLRHFVNRLEISSMLQYLPRYLPEWNEVKEGQTLKRNTNQQRLSYQKYKDAASGVLSNGRNALIEFMTEVVNIYPRSEESEVENYVTLSIDEDEDTSHVRESTFGDAWKACYAYTSVISKVFYNFRQTQLRERRLDFDDKLPIPNYAMVIWKKSRLRGKHYAVKHIIYNYEYKKDKKTNELVKVKNPDGSYKYDTVTIVYEDGTYTEMYKDKWERMQERSRQNLVDIDEASKIRRWKREHNGTTEDYYEAMRKEEEEARRREEEEARRIEEEKRREMRRKEEELNELKRRWQKWTHEAKQELEEIIPKEKLNKFLKRWGDPEDLEKMEPSNQNDEEPKDEPKEELSTKRRRVSEQIRAMLEKIRTMNDKEVTKYISRFITENGSNKKEVSNERHVLVQELSTISKEHSNLLKKMEARSLRRTLQLQILH